MSHEKQGHMGSLSCKTDEEIRDLLRRQENVASDKKFVGRLPDKGEKIMLLIERLKQELKQREKVDETADIFHKMALNAERTRRAEVQNDEETGGNETLLRNIVNSSNEEKIVVDERKETSTAVDNAYERVIKRQNEKLQHKAKFHPNRATKTSNVSEVKKSLLSDMSKQPNRDVISMGKPIDNTTNKDADINTKSSHVMVSETKQRTESHDKNTTKDASMNDSHRLGNEKQKTSTSMSDSAMDSSICSDSTIKWQHKTLQDPGVGGNGLERLRYRYDEQLEVSGYAPPVNHPAGAQLLDLKFSMVLLKEQTKKLEQLQADQAAEKLAGRLGTAFANPEGSSLHRYREVADTDSDNTSDEERDGLD